MLKKKLEDALNEQINKELYSAYLYLSMSAHFETLNLSGFASWMRVQTQEEMVHAMKFFEYINERGGKVQLKGIEAPPTKWETPLDVFEETYKHECLVTKSINRLVDLAEADSDHATKAFLMWFVTEQVEEEASASKIVEQLKMLGDSTGGLFMMDRGMGKRTFSAPAKSED